MKFVCSLIYDKIDKDKDGFVTEDELRDWIKHVQNKYVWEDTERQWKEHESEDQGLKWESYKKRTYGFLDGMSLKVTRNIFNIEAKRSIPCSKRSASPPDPHCCASCLAAFVTASLHSLAVAIGLAQTRCEARLRGWAQILDEASAMESQERKASPSPPGKKDKYGNLDALHGSWLHK